MNGPALWVEGEGNSPNATIRIETHLFHVGMARAAECVDAWPSEQWPFLFEQVADCIGFTANLVRQFKEFSLKIFIKDDLPLHFIILFKVYSVKSIANGLMALEILSERA